MLGRQTFIIIVFYNNFDMRCYVSNYITGINKYCLTTSHKIWANLNYTFTRMKGRKTIDIDLTRQMQIQFNFQKTFFKPFIKTFLNMRLLFLLSSTDGSASFCRILAPSSSITWSRPRWPAPDWSWFGFQKCSGTQSRSAGPDRKQKLQQFRSVWQKKKN